MAKSVKKNYLISTIVAFMQLLEDAGIIDRNAHENEKLVNGIKECCELTPSELEKYKNKPSVVFFNTEFSDWIETYQEEE